MAVISEIFKYEMQRHFDIRYEKIVPNYAKKGIFHCNDVTDDVTGWPQIRPSIFMFGRGSLRDEVAIHANIEMVFLCYTCLKKL